MPVSYISNLIDGSVSAETEICSGDIVTDGSWNHGHWNTELGVFVTKFGHHQYSVERLHIHTHTGHLHIHLYSPETLIAVNNDNKFKQQKKSTKSYVALVP